MYDGCCWPETLAPATRGLDDVAAAALPAAGATFGLVPVDCAEFEVEPELVPATLPGARLESVWLIEISWSSWFNETICPTIAVGSTGDVGSWFCNSVTRRLRNVVCRLLAEVAEEALLDELLELDAAFGELAAPAVCGAAILGVNP